MSQSGATIPQPCALSQQKQQYFLSGKSKNLLSKLSHLLLSTIQWLQGVLVNLQTDPQQRSEQPLARVMSSRLFVTSMEILPVVLPFNGPKEADSLKLISYWSGNLGGVWRRTVTGRRARSKNENFLFMQQKSVEDQSQLVINNVNKFWMKSQLLALYSNQLFQHIRKNKKQLLLFSALLSALYMIFMLFQLSVILAFLIFIGSLGGYAYLRWKALRAKGIINAISPKTKQVLLTRSIFDIYRDLVYFPLATKIAGAFIKGAVQKPPPDSIHELFEQLPLNIQNAINTKGILHLAPAKVEELFLNKEGNSKNENENNVPALRMVPDVYGKVNTSWYNQQKYDQIQLKTHERTFGSQILLQMNEKLAWKHVLGLAGIVCYGMMKTKSKKIGRILLYNGSVAGVLLVLVLILVKLKKPQYSEILAKQKNKIK